MKDFVLFEWPKQVARGRGATERLKPLFDGRIHSIDPVAWGYRNADVARRALHRHAELNNVQIRTAVLKTGKACRLVLQKKEGPRA